MKALQVADGKMVHSVIPLLTAAANHVDAPAPEEGATRSLNYDAKARFLLRRGAGQEPVIWHEFLFGALLSSTAAEDLMRLNPYLDRGIAEALLDAVAVVVLRANRIGHVNRCIAGCVTLAKKLDKALQLPSHKRAEGIAVLLPNLAQASEGLAGNLSAQRHYVGEKGNGQWQMDPRFAIFEFTWNIVLRKKQVQIVNNFLGTLGQTPAKSKVKQMIMGAGKTTVVAPLLALMLADGKSLVLSVVPKALLEMSRKLMRETFATIMAKRIYTLKFERSTTVTKTLASRLANAAVNRGIVVATPTSVKSVALVYVETLGQIAESRAGTFRGKPSDLAVKATELSKVLKLFKDGVMLLDEVDLILHPLKSELNFPCGDKFDLDVSEQGERWGLPMHLVDAVFFPQEKRVTTFEGRGVALGILEKLSATLEEGVELKALQRLPHITLLNHDFYHKNIKPIVAEWAYLWLQKQHLHGVNREDAIQYILEGAAAQSDAATKVKLIEFEMSRIRVELGEEDEAPEPAEGDVKRTRSEEEREAEQDKEDELCRTQSMNVTGAENLQLKLQKLGEALETAKTQQGLIAKVFEIESHFESRLQDSAANLSKIQVEISQIERQISELETPKDTSLDNSVVLWLSQAFGSATVAEQGASGRTLEV